MLCRRLWWRGGGAKRGASFARASVAVGVGVGLALAVSVLPCAQASSHGSEAGTGGADGSGTGPMESEWVHPLAQCQGFQADSYCCGMGNGGGWGWLPAFPLEYTWDPGFRGFLYGIGLIWAFFGVAILSDAFMAGIETITGQTRTVTVKDKDGMDVTTEQLVWNPAVANLTLLALGSSAPEILLSCIEVGSSGGYFGAIGAPTVVGSAAFNLFVITGLCMLAIPEGETRKIEGIPTFVLTSVFSVLAYLWVCVIVLWSSPNIILVWEALVTFLMMPVLTILVFMVDQGYFRYVWCACV